MARLPAPVGMDLWGGGLVFATTHKQSFPLPHDSRMVPYSHLGQGRSTVMPESCSKEFPSFLGS